MSYTVVSHGRVLGTTEFEYRRWKEGLRGGSFLPAADADPLIEIAVGVSPAVITLGKKIREMDRQRDQASPTLAAYQPRGKRTTEDADYDSACDRQEGLDLELRGPDGSLIETEWIALQDTEFLLSLADEDAEFECDDWSDCDWETSEAELSALEDDEMPDELEGWDDNDDLPWIEEQPFPRYQIFVTLVADADVP